MKNIKVVHINDLADLNYVVNNNTDYMVQKFEKLDKKARVAGVGFLMLAVLTFINNVEHDKFESRLSKLEQKGE